MTNRWIYYKLINPDKCKKSEARADYYLSIAQHLVKPGYDWSAKYKVPIDLDEVNEQDRSEQLPRPRRSDKAINDVMMDMDRAEFEDKCEFINFSSVPFDVKKRS